MRVDILTIFPGIFQGFLGESIVRIAQEKGLLEVLLHDFRSFAKGPRRSVDDQPFGGGPGMVLKPEPVFDCLDELLSGLEHPPRMLLPSPVGRRLDQALVRELSKEEHLVILCGRYEGYDERIVIGWPFEEVSIGDYVLTGGEVPAMVLVDSVTRLIPGALGHDLSAQEDSFERPLLDHPHYTRPAEFRGLKVPEVLLSGNHARVAQWRRAESINRTLARRPDLLKE
ncbi:MAG TPA: tRNA (guanosine(37)-N1)-methyltransferase TrmD [Planctomycetota bacterium]|nr:tRNA (guanosine(37)-N1)-methyltransferase TrmD [Planctomycetota bacterium]